MSVGPSGNETMVVLNSRGRPLKYTLLKNTLVTLYNNVPSLNAINANDEIAEVLNEFPARQTLASQLAYLPTCLP